MENREHKPGEQIELDLPCGVKMTFCWCPATTSASWKAISGGNDFFLMGSPESDRERFAREKQHRVKLTEGFWMGMYEVTQEQWERVMGRNPSAYKGSNRPVTDMSWKDTQDFVRRINVEGTLQVALPTEAQWEYACRAGTTTPYCHGDVLYDSQANFDSFRIGLPVFGDCRREPRDVGTYRPNDWNLFDMHGNVSEWCADWAGEYDGDATDPTGPVVGRMRICRGGSSSVRSRFCRSAARDCASPDVPCYCGLRLVCLKAPDRIRKAESAEPEDAEAEFARAEAYAVGRGVAKNGVAALAWYRRAAARGHVRAQFTLAETYLCGRGVAANEQEAISWFRQAAEQGHAESQFKLANLLGRVPAATEWYRRAAKQGHVDAQLRLAEIIFLGVDGKLDKAEAMMWARKAADQGSVRAKTRVAWCHLRGYGVEESRAEALRWFRMAADEGDGSAAKIAGILARGKSAK